MPETPEPDAPAAPNPQKQIYVDYYATGGYVLLDAPPGWWFDWRITLPRKENVSDGNGGYVEKEVNRNFEHVETIQGVWCYRHM